MTIGPERPPYGARHARLSPVGDHLTGRFFSVEMPSRAGPRHSAQSLKAKMEKARQRFREMEIRLVILEARHWLWMNAYLTTQKNCFGIKKSLRACNPEDVQYVRSRCCVTKFLRLILSGSDWYCSLQESWLQDYMIFRITMKIMYIWSSCKKLTISTR